MGRTSLSRSSGSWTSRERRPMSEKLNGWNTDESDIALEILDDDGPSIASDETVELVEFGPLPGDDIGGEGSGIDLLLDINLNVSVELGRTSMTIGEVLALRSSSVIELDKLAGEPVDILVNGTRIARAGPGPPVDGHAGNRLDRSGDRPERRARSVRRTRRRHRHHPEAARRARARLRRIVSPASL